MAENVLFIAVSLEMERILGSGFLMAMVCAALLVVKFTIKHI